MTPVDNWCYWSIAFIFCDSKYLTSTTRKVTRRIDPADQPFGFGKLFPALRELPVTLSGSNIYNFYSLYHEYKFHLLLPVSGVSGKPFAGISLQIISVLKILGVQVTRL